MNRFTKNNLRNIRQTFEEKTGVNLNVERRVSPKKTTYLLLAAALCALLLASCARTLFSGLNGDDLSLKGTYLGDGIVSIEVVNRSDKSLEFQKQVKLMGWRNGEVEPLPGGTVRVENIRFPAHSGGHHAGGICRKLMTSRLSKTAHGGRGMRPGTIWF